MPDNRLHRYLVLAAALAATIETACQIPRAAFSVTHPSLRTLATTQDAREGTIDPIARQDRIADPSRAQSPAPPVQLFADPDPLAPPHSPTPTPDLATWLAWFEALPTPPASSSPVATSSPSPGIP